MKFEEYKHTAMRKLKEALIKNEVDEPILPYLEILNSKKNIYTTSSCYGRITIDEVPVIDDKKQHRWIGKWHRTITLEDIKDRIDVSSHNVIYLKQDPFILHIGVKDTETANILLSIARNIIGLKRSGIMHLKPRIMLEIMGLDNIAMPIKYKNTLLIDIKQIDKIIDILNTKFQRNEQRLKRFVEEVDKVLE